MSKPSELETARGPEIRIAMWSGPRSLSTALMRSWGNRADTAVIDEPLYAYFLKSTGRPDPGAAEVIAGHESDWRKVVQICTGPVPGGRRIFYQKHMAHHLLRGVKRDWFEQVRHAFLIRDPREILISFSKVMANPGLEETGYPQLLDIFSDLMARTGKVPPIIDQKDVLQAPEATLRRLCTALAVEFDPAMLSWPAGARSTDGVWAPHWYQEVEKSTGFAPYRANPEPLPAGLEAAYQRAQALYRVLHDQRLQP